MFDEKFTFIVLPTMSISMLKSKVAERMEVDPVLVSLFADPKRALHDDEILLETGVSDNMTLIAEVTDGPLEIVLCAFVGQVHGALILSFFSDAGEEDSEKFHQVFKKLLKAAKSKLKPGEKIRLHVAEGSDAGLYAIRTQSGDRVYAAFLSDLKVSEAPVLSMLGEIKAETEKILDSQEMRVVKEKMLDEDPYLTEITTFLGHVVPRYDAIIKSVHLDRVCDLA